MADPSTPLAGKTPSTPRDDTQRAAMNPPPRVSYSNDPTLVQRCLNGDQSAWDELVQRYGRLIYAIPRHYGLSEQDASDVMQNVLEIVLKNLRKLRQQDRLSAWLITIAQHETMRLMKRGKRERSDEWQMAEDVPHLSRDFQRIERAEILRQALDRLEPTERNVILALLEDPPPSYDELTKTLKIPRGSIAYWRKRALEHLRSYLRELGLFT